MLFIYYETLLFCNFLYVFISSYFMFNIAYLPHVTDICVRTLFNKKKRNIDLFLNIWMKTLKTIMIDEVYR